MSVLAAKAERVPPAQWTTIGVERSDQVSSDGLFSFEEVECLGACEYAPMMRLDHRYFYDLNDQKVDALVAERRGKPAVTADKPKPKRVPRKKPGG